MVAVSAFIPPQYFYQILPKLKTTYDYKLGIEKLLLKKFKD
jgi:hypothetical protein